MSYILDALKRSEQERHQNELNHSTIDTIMMPRKPTRHQWWPYILIIVLCLNIFLFFYYQTFVGLSEQDNEAVEVSDNLTKHSKVNVGDDLHLSAPAEKAQSVAEKPLPTHLLQTPKLSKRYDASTLVKNNDEHGDKVKLNTDGFEVIRPKGYSESDQAIAMPSAKPESISNQMAQASVDELREDKPINEALRNVEEPDTDHHASNFDDILHLNDMALDFQKQIPDIRFNSHIYSHNPNDRRVMINDLYLREGQDFSGVMIETIGEFYVVLSKNSQRFKIPVLRDWYSPH